MGDFEEEGGEMNGNSNGAAGKNAAGGAQMSGSSRSDASAAGGTSFASGGMPVVSDDEATLAEMEPQNLADINATRAENARRNFAREAGRGTQDADGDLASRRKDFLEAADFSRNGTAKETAQSAFNGAAGARNNGSYQRKSDGRNQMNQAGSAVFGKNRGAGFDDFANLPGGARGTAANFARSADFAAVNFAKEGNFRNANFVATGESNFANQMAKSQADFATRPTGNPARNTAGAMGQNGTSLNGANPTGVANSDGATQISREDEEKMAFIKTYTQEFDETLVRATEAMEQILAAIDTTIREKTAQIEIPEGANEFLASPPEDGKVEKFDDAREIIAEIMTQAEEARKNSEAAAKEAAQIYDEVQEFKRETAARIEELMRE